MSQTKNYIKHSTAKSQMFSDIIGEQKGLQTEQDNCQDTKNNLSLEQTYTRS